MLAAVDTHEYNQLYTLLDITTSLDPLFDIAYRFGAVFLAEAYPAGAGRADLAVKLLEKGIAARPDKWEYMQDIGFVYYWYAHDYRQAAAWFQKASEVPGAPGVAEVARGDDAGAGRRSASRRGRCGTAILRVVRRRLAAQHRRAACSLQLNALDQIDAIQSKLDAFARQSGASAVTTGRRVVRARVFPGVPVDPSGTPLRADAARAAFACRQSSPLFPLPVEPQAARARQR